MAKNKDITKSWKKAFLQSVVRAIRKMHIDHAVWSVGQEINDAGAFERLNNGPGIEMGYETAVCSAITHEFSNSRFTNGNMYLDKARYYQCDREVKFDLVRRKNKFVDIFINRYALDKKNEVHYYRYPALIEVKRAHLYTPEPISGIPARLSQAKRDKSIVQDVKKLLSIRKLLVKGKGLAKNKEIHFRKYKGELKDAFLYVLCWGSWNTDSKVRPTSDEPSHIIDVIENSDGVTGIDSQVIWLPTQWKPTRSAKRPPKITSYLWIALVEVNPLKLKGKDDDECKRWIKLDRKTKKKLSCNGKSRWD